MIGYSLIHNVSMPNFLVLKDIERFGGLALNRLVHEMPASMQTAYLCASSIGNFVDGINLSHDLIGRVVEKLIKTKVGALNRA